MAQENTLHTQTETAHTRHYPTNELSDQASASDTWMERQVLKSLENLKHGGMEVLVPTGNRFFFGDVNAELQAIWEIKDWATVRRSFARGDVGFGEAYIFGEWDSPNIETLIRVFIANEKEFEELAHGNQVARWFFQFIDRFWRRNHKAQSRRNIRAHYDIGNEFYQLWLDETMTYSSALYADKTLSLADAQRAKYGRILQETAGCGDKVLEIGCGWGGFAEQAAAQGQHVTGLTLSKEQAKFARNRLGNKADIALRDYRDEKGIYDSIVSIEMFEAVGERYWADYFNQISRALKQGGKAVVQTITIEDSEFDHYRKRSDFIRQYTFPGGMLPSAQRFEAAAKQANLICHNVIEFGQDYAQTLRLWASKFEQTLPQIKLLGQDEEFIRQWRFYLHYCAAAFASGRTNVMQVSLRHS